MDPERICQELEMLKHLMYEDPAMVLGKQRRSSIAPLQDIGNSASKRAKTTKIELTTVDQRRMKAADEYLFNHSKNVHTHAFSCSFTIHML